MNSNDGWNKVQYFATATTSCKDPKKLNFDKGEIILLRAEKGDSYKGYLVPEKGQKAVMKILNKSDVQLLSDENVVRSMKGVKTSSSFIISSPTPKIGYSLLAQQERIDLNELRIQHAKELSEERKKIVELQMIVSETESEKLKAKIERQAVEELRKTIENLTTEINLQRNSNNELQIKYDDSLLEVKRSEAECDKLKQTNKSLDTKVKFLEKKIEQIQSSNSGNEQAENQIKYLQESITIKENEIKYLKGEERKLAGELNTTSLKIMNFERNERNMKNEVNQVRKENTDLSQSKFRLEKQLLDMEDGYEVVRKGAFVFEKENIELKEKIVKLEADIDELLLKQESLLKEIQEGGAKKQLLEQQQLLIDDLNNKLNKEKESNRNLQLEIQDLTNKYNKEKEEHEKTKRELNKALEEANKQIQNLNLQVTDLSNKLHESNEQNKKKDQIIQDLKKQINQLSEENKNLRIEITNLNRLLDEERQKYQQAQQQIQNLQNENKDLKNRLNETLELNKKANLDIQDLTNLNKKMKEENEKSNQNIHNLQHALEEERKKNQENQKIINELREENEKLKKELADLQDSFKKEKQQMQGKINNLVGTLKNRDQTIVQLKNERSEVDKVVEEQKQTITKMMNEKNKLNDDLLKLKQQIEELTKLNERNEQIIRELTGQLKEANQKIRNLLDSKKTDPELLRRINDLEGEVLRYQDEIKVLKKFMNMKVNSLEEELKVERAKSIQNKNPTKN